jgi:hypothetical protein
METLKEYLTRIEDHFWEDKPFTRITAFQAFVQQDAAKIHFHDLIGEQPIPLFRCQECGREMVLLYPSKYEVFPSDIFPIGVACPMCFDASHISESPQLFPHFFCQVCGREMKILWSPANPLRIMGAVCPCCFNPHHFDQYYEHEDHDNNGEFY